MDKTTVTIVGLIVTAVLGAAAILSYSVSVNNSVRSKAIVEMVSKGADPIAAACALDGVNTANQTLCTNISSQQRK